LSTEGLKLTVEHSAGSRPEAEHRTLHMELMGQDRPGIVHEISSAIASHGISVDELTTEVEHASMAGGDLFKARANLHVPDNVDVEDLRETLESLANEIMVDINLDALEDA
jgi:glycine cleavage system regulatory protein